MDAAIQSSESIMTALGASTRFLPDLEGFSALPARTFLARLFLV